MKAKIIWGITPIDEEKNLPKFFEEETIEVKSIQQAKRKAKKLANQCQKIKEAYALYTRTWIYWKNWKKQSDNNQFYVESHDSTAITYKNREHFYKAFISISIEEKKGEKNELFS